MEIGGGVSTQRTSNGKPRFTGFLSRYDFILILLAKWDFVHLEMDGNVNTELSRRQNASDVYRIFY